MGGLLCVTAEGGFDRLRMSRKWQYVLVLLVALSFAALTLLRLELGKHPSMLERIASVAFTHVFPLLTIPLVLVNLQPRIAAVISLKAVHVPWSVLCSEQPRAVRRLSRLSAVQRYGGSARRSSHRWQGSNELSEMNLALIPQLDPKRDFTELIGFTSEFNSKAVREAAITQLRNPPSKRSTMSSRNPKPNEHVPSR